MQTCENNRGGPGLKRFTSYQGYVNADGLVPAWVAAIPSEMEIKTIAELPHEAEARAEVGRIRRLNFLLADEYRLYAITRDYHWNVTGPDYHSLRLLFQLQHEKAADWVDGLAELIRELRFDRRVSWDDLKNSTRCAAAAGFGLPAENMLVELLRVHNEMIAQLRADGEAWVQFPSDTSTAGFLSGLREQHENAAWMIRAQLGTAAELIATPA